MTYGDLITHFGSEKQVAHALGIKAPSVYGWKETGVPPLRQIQVQQITLGKLKAALDVFTVSTKRAEERAA